MSIHSKNLFIDNTKNILMQFGVILKSRKVVWFAQANFWKLFCIELFFRENVWPQSHPLELWKMVDSGCTYIMVALECIRIRMATLLLLIYENFSIRKKNLAVDNLLMEFIINFV